MILFISDETAAIFCENILINVHIVANVAWIKFGLKNRLKIFSG